MFSCRPDCDTIFCRTLKIASTSLVLPPFHIWTESFCWCSDWFFAICSAAAAATTTVNLVNGCNLCWKLKLLTKFVARRTIEAMPEILVANTRLHFICIAVQWKLCCRFTHYLAWLRFDSLSSFAQPRGPHNLQIETCSLK